LPMRLAQEEPKEEEPPNGWREHQETDGKAAKLGATRGAATRGVEDRGRRMLPVYTARRVANRQPD
jgi:hypothetical protein